MGSYDVITSGYVSMDRIIKLNSAARVGFTSIVENKDCMDIRYGGCSVNISYDLRRLGIKAMPVMRVGDDYESIGFKDFLVRSGIPMDAMQIVPGERTSVCYLIQDPQGQHITLFYPGAMDSRFADPIPADIFNGAKLAILAVGSRADNEIFLEMCIREGIPLVFSMKGDMAAFPKDLLVRLLEHSTMIFTNQVERETIEQTLGYDMESLLERHSCQYLITTMGADGSRCWYKEGGVITSVSSTACKAQAVVDTTGCGDGFLSGFIYGYLKGSPPEECLMLGSTLASFIVQEEGCCTSAPYEAQFLERYKAFYDEMRGGNI